MNKIKTVYIILGFTLILTSCKLAGNYKVNLVNTKHLLDTRYKMLLEYPVDSMAIPRSMNVENNRIRKVTSGDWTSGFFSGNLW